MTVATHQMRLSRAALLAFIAMCLNDCASTVMVVFESRLTPWLAGTFDVIGWVFSLICAALAIESIITNGWRTRRSLVLIAVVSVANFVGTVQGVYIAKAITRH